MKERIESAVSTVQRDGIDKLLKFVEESDFYTAPCSTKFHLACKGGLAQHTWNVMNCAVQINDRYEQVYKPESVILSAFGHDLCKVNFYKETDDPATDPQIRYLTSLLMKNGFRMPAKMNKTYASVLIDFLLKQYKVGMTLPPFTPSYSVNDQLPLGHGEKSLFVLQKFVELTDEEAMAVRWHMATFDAGIHFPYPSGYAYNEALKKSKLISIIMLADLEASNLIEV